MLRSQGANGFFRAMDWPGRFESESISYQNRNISIVISEGGVREGFYVFESSCDFLYNENLEWAYPLF